VDGNVAWETSLGDMLFGFLFDAIHHRGLKLPATDGGQGSVHLRSLRRRSRDIDLRLARLSPTQEGSPCVN
jgi:hypothetical protein